MFKKVLIAEDQDMMSISVRKTLEDLDVPLKETDYVFHCDTALSRIKKALRDGEPYELLLTDLSFAEDYTIQEIKNGIELIKAAKQVQPDIKVLVFSVEKRSAVADNLIRDYHIEGYVPKGRGDAQDLRLAVELLSKNKKYFSPKLQKDEKTYLFSNLDKAIIGLLLEGIPQKGIPAQLEARNIKPSGLSSVEKRLNLMRTALGFSNNEQLIAYCKDRHIL